MKVIQFVEYIKFQLRCVTNMYVFLCTLCE